MGATPTIAECRNAFVERAQLTRQSARVDNAEGSMSVDGMMQYRLVATLSPALTYGAINGKCVEYVSFIRPLVADITANIGDTCKVLLVSSSNSTTAPYDVELWIYKQFGWEKIITGGNSYGGSAGGFNLYTGTSVKVSEFRAEFVTNSCDNHNIYSNVKCSGTSQMGSAVRGKIQSSGNNSSITGGDFTAELDVANHSNGHLAALQGQTYINTGLTVTGGAMFSLLLTSYLGSAATGLNHGGAAFIALTDQTATKTKYLFDNASDGSSLIDTGDSNAHLEWYHGSSKTFTCYGGYRIMTAAGVECWIPFGLVS
jgi:hypothetical protein